MTQQNTQATYIEVIGEAEFRRYAIEHRVTVELYSESAAARIERHHVKKALDDVVAEVTAKGFSEDQIIFEGTQDFALWWGKKRGQFAQNSMRLMFRHEDLSMILNVPLWIDALSLAKVRHRIHGMTPVYDTDTIIAQRKANGEAIVNAQQVALAIAEAAGAKLGPLLQAQQLNNPAHENGPYMIGSGVVAAGAVESEPSDPFETVRVKLRARFALV